MLAGSWGRGGVHGDRPSSVMFGAVSVQPDSRILWTISEGPGPFLLGLPRAMVSAVLAPRSLGAAARRRRPGNAGGRAPLRAAWADEGAARSRCASSRSTQSKQLGQQTRWLSRL